MSSTGQPDEVLRELALSRAWNAQWLRPGAALRTTEGQPLTID